MAVRLSGESDLGAQRVGTPIAATFTLENDGPPVSCWRHLSAADVHWGQITRDGEPFTALFRPPGIPPLRARPLDLLAAGATRSVTIEDLFCHWQNLGPGDYAVSVRLGLGDTTTGPLALQLTLTE